MHDRSEKLVAKTLCASLINRRLKIPRRFELCMWGWHAFESKILVFVLVFVPVISCASKSDQVQFRESLVLIDYHYTQKSTRSTIALKLSVAPPVYLRVSATVNVSQKLLLVKIIHATNIKGKCCWSLDQLWPIAISLQTIIMCLTDDISQMNKWTFIHQLLFVLALPQGDIM